MIRLASTPTVAIAAALSALVCAVACGSTESARSSSSTTSSGAGGASSAVSLTLPQFVHGAAYLDRLAFPNAPLVIAFDGRAPDAVSVALDGAAPIRGVKEGDRFVAMLDVSALALGEHEVVATATIGARVVAIAKGAIVVADGSVQFSTFAEVGPATPAAFAYDEAEDRLALAFTDVSGGVKHRLALAYLDGALRRLRPDDIALSDPSDDALPGQAAFSKDAAAAVYRTPKNGAPHWSVKLRVVDRAGHELLGATDVTQGEAAFSVVAAGVDPGGFSAAWVHISTPASPSDPPQPLEVRFARWDAATKKVTTLTIDAEQPQPQNSQQGPLAILPLAPIGIACNATSCLVSYSREEYIPWVQLNVPKIHVGVVDLSTGALKGPPQLVAGKDWDTQEFGQQPLALADGRFAIVYAANDTAAALNPKSPCDSMLERDLLLATTLEADGTAKALPKPIFDFEGTREWPRFAVHPAGFALFWEDQRSECGMDGHLAMAMNVASADFTSLLDPYLEAPGAKVLPPMNPVLAVTSTNFVHAWSDNRHGNGLLDPKPEVFVDTYWRK